MVKLAHKLAAQLGQDLAFGADADRLLYALTGFSAANRYETQAGGGEAGDASGFGGGVAFVLASGWSLTRARYLYGRFSTSAGWLLYLSSTLNECIFYVINGASGAVSTKRTLSPSDMGKVIVLTGHHDGAEIQLSYGMDVVGSTPIAGFTASPETTTLGSGQAGGSYADGVHIIGAWSYRGRPSVTQRAAYAAAFRLTGDLPTEMDGAAVTHHWSAKRALSRRPLVAPPALKDTITRAPIDAMQRIGMPSVVTIDPARDGLQTRGAMGFSLANYLQTTGGYAGDANGFWVVGFPCFNALPTGTTARFLHKTNSINQGWRFYGHNSGAVFFNLFGSAEVNAGAAGVVTAGDLGQILPVIGVYTGTAARLIAKRAQVGADVPVTFVPSSAPMQMGRDSSAGADSVSMFGFATGPGVPSSSQIQDFFEAWERDRKVAGIPGMQIAQLVDLTLDIPGDTVPAQVQDRIGTDHLTRVGTLQLAQRTERVWSYEREPILHGVRDLSDAAYLESLTGFRGDAAGWWGAVLARCDAQGGTAGSRSLVSAAGAGDGWEARTMGVNSTMSCQIANGAGAFVSGPSGPILASDVGKLLLYILTFDPAAGRVRGYYKRAELSAPGPAIAGHTPALSATPVRIGHHATQAGFGATGMTVLGVAYGTGSIVLADAQALHDAVMAHERMVAMPGRATTVVNVDASGAASGFARVGAPTSAPVYSRAWAW